VSQKAELIYIYHARIFKTGTKFNPRTDKFGNSLSKNSN